MTDVNYGYIASMIPGVSTDPHINGRSARHRRRVELIEELSQDPEQLLFAIGKFIIADAYVAQLQAPERDMSRFSLSVSDP